MRFSDFARAYTSTQMHGLSTTSHRPFSVPPQGPFRIPLGQVCGQTYSMWPRTQLPQAWQPKSGDLMANSNRSMPWANFGRLSIQQKIVVRKSRSFPGLLTGKMRPSESSNRGTNPGLFCRADEEEYK